MRQFVSHLTEDIMLVGHLPHLSRLTTRLLCDDPKNPIVNFRNAGVICLARAYEGWSVEWIVIPDIIN